MGVPDLVRGTIAQGTVRTHRIVIASPQIEPSLRIGERDKLLRVQALVTQSPIERFDERVLHRLARTNERSARHSTAAVASQPPSLWV